MGAANFSTGPSFQLTLEPIFNFFHSGSSITISSDFSVYISREIQSSYDISTTVKEFILDHLLEPEDGKDIHGFVIISLRKLPLLLKIAVNQNQNNNKPDGLPDILGRIVAKKPNFDIFITDCVKNFFKQLLT
jgi:hypothetical protein